MQLQQKLRAQSDLQMRRIRGVSFRSSSVSMCPVRLFSRLRMPRLVNMLDEITNSLFISGIHARTNSMHT